LQAAISQFGGLFWIYGVAKNRALWVHSKDRGIVMEKLTADWGSDPDDNCNLILEIVHDYHDVAIIYQRKHGLIIKWYREWNGIAIPVDWFSGLLLAAKKDLNNPKAVIVEFTNNKWTVNWTKDPDSDDNFIFEILCDDEVVAVIKQSQQGLILQWYVSPDGLIISVDWLLDLLVVAKKDLG
jgi:hypothetical protein